MVNIAYEKALFEKSFNTFIPSLARYIISKDG